MWPSTDKEATHTDHLFTPKRQNNSLNSLILFIFNLTFKYSSSRRSLVTKPNPHDKANGALVYRIIQVLRIPNELPLLTLNSRNALVCCLGLLVEGHLSIGTSPFLFSNATVYFLIVFSTKLYCTSLRTKVWLY